MLGTRITPAELLGPLNEVEKRHAPRELFVAGDVSLASKGARVSIVGSRKASEADVKRASKLALDSLARAGHEWAAELQRHGALVLSDETKDLFLESLPEESRSEQIAASF